MTPTDNASWPDLPIVEADPLARATFIAKVAENRIAAGEAHPKEVRDLAQSLLRGVEDTLDILDDVDSDDRERARIALVNIFSAAFRLGSRITLPAPATQLVVDGSAHARQGKAERYSARAKWLCKAVISCAGGATLEDSDKFAGSLRPQLREKARAELGDLFPGGPWPSNRTIRRAIKATL